MIAIIAMMIAKNQEFMQINLKRKMLIFTLFLTFMNYTQFVAKTWLPHDFSFVWKVFWDTLYEHF